MVQTTIDLLEELSFLTDEVMEADRPRAEGEKWEGKGGLWFMMRGGRTVKIPAPAKTLGKSAIAGSLSPEKLATLPQAEKDMLKAGILPPEMGGPAEEPREQEIIPTLPTNIPKEEALRRRREGHSKASLVAADLEAWKTKNLPKEYHEKMAEAAKAQRELVADRVGAMLQRKWAEEERVASEKHLKEIKEKANQLFNGEGGNVNASDPDYQAVMSALQHRMTEEENKANEAQLRQAAQDAAAMGGAKPDRPTLRHYEGKYRIDFHDGRYAVKATNGVWRLLEPGSKMWRPLSKEDYGYYEETLRALKSGEIDRDHYDMHEGRKIALTATRIAMDYNNRLQRQGNVNAKTASSTSKLLAAMDLLTSGVLKRLGLSSGRIPWASILYAVGSNYKDPRKMVETAAGMVVDNADAVLKFADEQAIEGEKYALRKKREQDEMARYGEVLKPWDPRRETPYSGIDWSADGVKKATEEDENRRLKRKIRRLARAVLDSKEESADWAELHGLVNLMEEVIEGEEETPLESGRNEALIKKLLKAVSSHHNSSFYGLLVVQCYVITRDLASAIDSANHIWQSKAEHGDETIQGEEVKAKEEASRGEEGLPTSTTEGIEEIEETELDSNAGYVFSQRPAESHEIGDTVIDAHHEGKNVGYASLQHLPSNAVYLHSVYTHPLHRGKGLANALLKRVIAEHGHKDIVLKAMPFAGAHGKFGLTQDQLVDAYKKHGFEVTSHPGDDEHGTYMRRRATESLGEALSFLSEFLDEGISIAEASKHPEGEPWQGKSGRWFVMKKGRPVPYKKEGGESKTPPKEEKPKEEPKPLKGVKTLPTISHPGRDYPTPPKEEKQGTLLTRMAAPNRKDAAGEGQLYVLAKLEKHEADKRNEGKSKTGPPIVDAPPRIPQHLRNEKVRVYIVNSKFATGPIGILPKFGPLHHRGVFFCPSDQKPVIDGLTNPKCRGFGLQAGTEFFQPEANRKQSTYREVSLPASKVAEKIEHFKRKWSILHNCQHAANTVTQESVQKETSEEAQFQLALLSSYLDESLTILDEGEHTEGEVWESQNGEGKLTLQEGELVGLEN